MFVFELLSGRFVIWLIVLLVSFDFVLFGICDLVKVRCFSGLLVCRWFCCLLLVDCLLLVWCVVIVLLVDFCCTVYSCVCGLVLLLY